MAADVAKFSAAVDKAYKRFSLQDVHLDSRELRGLGDSERTKAIQHIEQKFQQHLQRARAAFLQEFRNHSVVVESEVRKIRQELWDRFEAKYGHEIKLLREQLAEEKSQSQKYMDDIVKLKAQVTEQEANTAAMRERLGLDKKEELRAEIKELKEELEGQKKDNGELSQQLAGRDNLVSQLRAELSGLEEELKRQAGSFTEERRIYDERLRGLRLEMRQQQDQFKEHLKEYEEKFAEYRAKTSAELQIQYILNSRQSEALASMEEERRQHLRARQKPTSRIGEGDAECEEQQRLMQLCKPYELCRNSRYRVDDMGMDTSWRDYRLGDTTPLPRLAQKARPTRFNVVRGSQASVGPNPPTATEHPRPEQQWVPQATTTVPVLAPPDLLMR